ncbi:membrane protein [Mycobacterium xenopi]|uniref:Membrane protein n=1 Tax=Mycobacterium xenopi TaxID=1789 RepID=A0AAD1H258_MYCXE|nr:membrane protein [Mycobacterium xenopi]
MTRATASGPTRGWPSVAARGAVAIAVGMTVAELAGLAVLSGSIDRRLAEQAVQRADSAPAVAQASTNLDRARAARSALDNVVEQARAHRDEALVVARCEYNPTPACPQTRITGVPGVGPETRAANDLLADAQRELDTALAARDRRAPELDAQIAAGEQELEQARRAAIADADHGLGARWAAMYDLTFGSAGVLAVRLLVIALCAALYVLPLILRLWRGETSHDRHAAARAERDRAELQADTAIAVKRAEVRQAAETMRADQQLASARLAAEAQTEIDRAQQRRQVAEALEGHAREYPPIAAKAAGEQAVCENLPARVERRDTVEPGHERGAPLIADVTKTPARWIRPLVPGFVARAVDTTTQPLRAARQMFEDVEEITFSLKRTRRVTVSAEDRGSQVAPDSALVKDRPAASRGRDHLKASAAPREVEIGDRPAELDAPEVPRQLPPGK